MEGSALQHGIAQRRRLRPASPLLPLQLHPFLPGVQCSPRRTARPQLHRLDILTESSDLCANVSAQQPRHQSKVIDVSLHLEHWHRHAIHTQHLVQQLLLVTPGPKVAAPAQEAALRCIAAPKHHGGAFGLQEQSHSVIVSAEAQLSMVICGQLTC